MIKIIFNKISTNLWAQLLFIIFIYSIYCIPKSFIIFRYSDIVPTLQHFYFSKLLFIDYRINNQLSELIITPSNPAFIFTPGVFYLIELLKDFKSIIIFTHFSNIVFILLFYTLLRKKSSAQLSIISTIVLILLSINVQWFGPDYLALPYMMGVIFLLFYFDNLSKSRIVLIGLLCGIIFIFKQNFGLFFLVATSTSIFFLCLEKRNKTNFFSLFLVFIYLIYGIYFFNISNFFINKIFFLLSYFIFWLYVIYLLLTKWSFNGFLYLKRQSLLIISVLIIPSFLIISFGNVIGYKNYFYSLFLMGFDFINFWEYNIYEMIISLKIRDLNEIYITLSKSFSLIFPFFLNLFLLLKVLRLKNHKLNFELRQKFSVFSFGLISIFLFFPFEDFRISNTKIFIYLFIFSYFFYSVKFYLKYYIVSTAFILFIFIQIYHNFNKVNDIKNRTTNIENKYFKSIVNVKVKNNEGVNLDNFLLHIEANIKDQPFYLITQNLLLTPILLTNTKNLQYYMRLDNEFLNDELTGEIKLRLDKIKYVVVTQNEFHSFIQNSKNNNFFSLINYLKENFEIISSYDELSKTLPKILILKNKR